LYTLACGRGSTSHGAAADRRADSVAEGARSNDAVSGRAAPNEARGDSREDGERASADAAAKVACTPDPHFPGVFDVPEGSAAAEVELRPGVRELLVVSDSGHHGAALARAIPNGPTRSLTLPVDPKVSDDLEGIAWRGGHLYAIVSSGMVERFTPDGKGGLRRDGDAYPIGPEPFVCHDIDPSESNCGKNYEGLCLRAESETARCAGYVASKREGWLGCVVFVGERLVLDRIKPRLTLGLPKNALSDCAFGTAGGPAAGVLLVTTNIFGGSTSYIVHEGSGALAPIDVSGTLTNEAIAVDRDGALYQVMDDNGASSPVLRATCTGW
jgi:hypothetical protein